MRGAGGAKPSRAKYKTASLATVRRLVVIVDDDAAVRIAVDSLLRSVGHRSAMHDSAETFLASRDVHRAACVICDIRLKGMSGLELAELLSQRGSHLPIILISALPVVASEVRAAAVGVLCILTKPFDREAFFRALEQALSD